MAISFQFDRPQMDWDSKEIGAEFKDFRDYVELLFKGPHCNGWTDAQKASAIVSWSGVKGRKAFSTFTWADAADKDKPKEVLDKFQAHVEPKTNKWLARFDLHELRQTSDQPIDEFLAQCMRQASKCKLADQNAVEERVLEQIIVGVRDYNIQQKLLAKGDALDLNDALDIARSVESTKRHLSQLRSSTSDTAVTAHAVRGQGQNNECRNCGRKHPFKPKSQCAAYGQTCNGCGKKNHFVRYCRSKGQGQRQGNSAQPQQNQTPSQQQGSQQNRQQGNNQQQQTYWKGRRRPGKKSKGHGQGQRQGQTYAEIREDLDTLEGAVGGYQMPPDDDGESLLFSSVQIDTVVNNEVFANLGVQLPHRPDHDDQLRVKVDSRAEGNLLPLRVYKRMFPHNIGPNGTPRPGATIPSNKHLFAYGGKELKHYGMVLLRLSFGRRRCRTVCYVTEDEGPPLLGLPTCQALKLITVHCEVTAQSQPVQGFTAAQNTAGNTATTQQPSPNSLGDAPLPLPPLPPPPPPLPPSTSSVAPLPPDVRIESAEHLVSLYPDRFEGIGNFSGEYHITVDPSYPPQVHPPRRPPLHMRDKMEFELREMENLGVIKKVTEAEPTTWVNSMVWEQKPSGRLRPCLDPTDLNKAIIRCHHVTPTLEEITHRLAGSTVFSILDATHGYWAVKLDEESSYLTTFNTFHPHGRYRFLRCPFGLKMSQDVYQQRMDMILEECPGTVSIADDVCVHGATETEHDANLHNLMRVARKHGLVFNPKKAKVKQTRIKFYGVIFGADGIRADPDKIEAVKSLQPPTNKKELSQFLGIATYMAPFIPHLSQHTDPLRALIKSNVPWEWNATHTAAFQKIKSLICSPTSLAYYRPDRPLSLQVDASLAGLGGALIQEGRPVAFCSKALTGPESRYANIERELLAVVHGCQKFHTYLYGRSFTVESDHKPLEMISLKHISEAPARLQRMLLRLQPYDFTIIFKPGREMYIADALSRLAPLPGEPVNQMDVNIHIVAHEMSPEPPVYMSHIHAVRFTPAKLEQLKQETRSDPEMNALREIIYTGWPDRRQDTPLLLHPYWTFRDELAVEDGLVVKGDRVVIPKPMRRDILEQIHYAHQGIEKCRQRAQQNVYWPGMYKEIENAVKECGPCQEFQKSNPSETLLPHDVPTRPWQVLGTDLFTIDAEDYLLIADYYSKSPFVRKLPVRDSTSATVVHLTKQIFSEQGIPETVYSDNGPQYDSNAYRQFAAEWGFNHVTSSPHFAQSNGLIERMVQTVKPLIKKAIKDGRDPEMALLCLRTTPIDSKLPSPAELLNNRKLVVNLPTRVRYEDDAVKERLQTRQDTQKMYHDRTAHDLPSLVPGQPVSVQDKRTGQWKPGTIESIRPEPRSYTVNTGSGTVRRNRAHLRPAAMPSAPTSEPHSHILDMDVHGSDTACAAPCSAPTVAPKTPAKSAAPRPATTPAPPRAATHVAPQRATPQAAPKPTAAPPTPTPVITPAPTVTRSGRVSKPKDMSDYVT